MLLVLAILLDFLIHLKSTIVLQGFFTNDEYNLFPAKQMIDDYENYLDLTGNRKVIFEDSLFLDLGSSKDYVTASASKIVAYTSAKELDFLVTTEPLMLHYLEGFALEDLRNLTRGDLIPCLYFGKDGNHKYEAVAIDMTTSRFIQGRKLKEKYYLLVPENSKRKEAVREFLSYAFPISGTSQSPRDR